MKNHTNNHTQNNSQIRNIFNAFTCALLSILLFTGLLTGCTSFTQASTNNTSSAATTSPTIPNTSNIDATVANLADVPDYFGEDYIELNGGNPTFSTEDMAVADGTEIYGELDHLGRATYAFAKLCENTCPKPGSIRDTNMPDPTGFLQAFYPEAGINHLYERSHLIAYSLSDEATNPRDLITGTQHLNQSVMGDFERAIRNWINVANEELDRDNHVLMRVTPDFRDDELVARGVQIEALSMEDGGESVHLNVYCYNIQPGVIINYATGESRLDSAFESPTANSMVNESEQTYILNINTKRFHHPDCSSINNMKPENRQTTTAERSDLIAQGYKPCTRCNS